MKCTSCNTFVTKIPINWKCPHCGEKLPEPTKWEIFKDALLEWLNNKGVVFWAIWFGLLLIVSGVAEIPFGHIYLLEYLGSAPLLAIISIFFGGMLIDMVMKINLPLKLPFGSDFLINERKPIRNIRKVTNGALLLGIICSLIFAGPLMFFQYFNAYLMIIGWWLAFAWSLIGIFIDPKLTEDVRFRFFIDERLGVASLKRFKTVGRNMIGLLVLIAIAFNLLLATHNIWAKMNNIVVVGAIVKISKAYLGWLI